MLLYLDYPNEIISIGICDCGIASWIDKKAPLHYVYSTSEETKWQWEGRCWVALKLLYTFGLVNSNMSFSSMQSTHKYIEKSNLYSIGKLMEWMKIGDLDNFD